MSIEPYVQQIRQQIAETAREMIGGNLSFIEGARKINRLRWNANLQDFDPDIIPFIGIDSETDSFPFGEVRQHWLPEAVDKLQPEIDRAEQWAQQVGQEACLKLIERFSRPEE